MSRTREELNRHAEQERKYRAERREERFAAQEAFAESVRTLLDHSYTVGTLVDLLIRQAALVPRLKKDRPS